MTNNTLIYNYLNTYKQTPLFKISGEEPSAHDLLNLQSTYFFHIAVLNEVAGNRKEPPNNPEDEYFKAVKKDNEVAGCWETYLSTLYKTPPENTGAYPFLQRWHQGFTDVYKSNFELEGKDQHAEREVRLLNQRLEALRQIKSEVLPNESSTGLNMNNNSSEELVNIMQLLGRRMKFNETCLAIEEVLIRIKKEYKDYEMKRAEEKEADFAAFKEVHYGSALE
ncbi:hypothetical protein HYFRA_00000208 [Hymenoscyphus fraxineus]|uniref:Uncharacterized protein n=1 Tax=Hymenoscyphus fraxineus TaxID=746836 RepID=A0A9N9L499_9HELO|nr:hypothetical protein HYFRA_00000208 [Hymenoscyphus fraxineus]